MFAKLRGFFLNFLWKNKMSFPKNKDGQLDSDIINCILAVVDQNGKVIKYIAITKSGIFFQAPSALLEQLIRNSGISVINIKAELFQAILENMVELVNKNDQLIMKDNLTSLKLIN
jgi:hypothetical protein